MRRRRIAILTGGGDCPGINAVIRAVVKKAIIEKDAEVIGIEDGFHGIVNNHYRTLTYGRPARWPRRATAWWSLTSGVIT